MTIVKDIRKTVTDTTPVYAVVGVTDLAIERIRDAGTRAAAVRLDLDVSKIQGKIQDRATKRFEKVSEQAQQFPTQLRSQTVEAADKAKETYSELAVRGENLVKRIRNQKSTKDLLAQAGSTVSLGKGAVTTVRKAAHDTQQAAKVTLATGRREAGTLAASVQGDVKSAGHNGSKAADDAVVTVKKSTASAERAAKAAATSARKTAAAASAATKTATSKVGD